MAAQNSEIHPRWLGPEEFIKQHDRQGTESARVWSEPGSHVSVSFSWSHFLIESLSAAPGLRLTDVTWPLVSYGCVLRLCHPRSFQGSDWPEQAGCHGL